MVDLPSAMVEVEVLEDLEQVETGARLEAEGVVDEGTQPSKAQKASRSCGELFARTGHWLRSCGSDGMLNGTVVDWARSG